MFKVLSLAEKWLFSSLKFCLIKLNSLLSLSVSTMYKRVVWSGRALEGIIAYYVCSVHYTSWHLPHFSPLHTDSILLFEFKDQNFVKRLYVMLETVNFTGYCLKRRALLASIRHICWIFFYVLLYCLVYCLWTQMCTVM